MIEKSIQELDLSALIRKKKKYFASPPAWEDQVMYFLMLDRFSDGKEQGLPGSEGKGGFQRDHSVIPAG